MNVKRALMLLTLPVAAVSAVYAQDTQYVPDPPGFDRSFVNGFLGQGIVGKAVEAPVIDEPAEYMVLQPGVWTYHLVGGHAGSPYEIEELGRIGRAAEHGSWSRRVGNRAVSYLDVDEQGSVRRACHQDSKEAVMSRFDPPEYVLVKGMRPGESKTVEIKVQVMDITKPDKVKYKGKLTLTYTYVGAFEVTVPAGRYETILVSEEYKGKVGPAKIEDHQCTFLAKGIGKVASIEQQSISAMFFYHKDTRCGRLLVEQQASGGSTALPG